MMNNTVKEENLVIDNLIKDEIKDYIINNFGNNCEKYLDKKSSLLFSTILYMIFDYTHIYYVNDYNMYVIEKDNKYYNCTGECRFDDSITINFMI